MHSFFKLEARPTLGYTEHHRILVRLKITAHNIEKVSVQFKAWILAEYKSQSQFITIFTSELVPTIQPRNNENKPYHMYRLVTETAA